MPVAGGGDVRGTSALTQRPAGEPGRNPAFRHNVFRHNVSRHNVSRSPNIADRYALVLRTLSPRQRQGVIAALSVGFYDGWRPTRAELAAYVAAEFGVTVTAPPETSPR